MTTSAAVIWVKIVIDGDDSYDAFPCTFTSGMNIVHDLKDAVAMKYQFALTSLSIDVPDDPDEDAESLPPYLLLSDPGFPSGISGPTPFIVTAQSRQQQVSLVSRWLLLAVAIIPIFAVYFIADLTAVLLARILALPSFTSEFFSSRTPQQKGPTDDGYQQQHQQQQYHQQQRQQY
jgi:hypothetical protein